MEHFPQDHDQAKDALDQQYKNSSLITSIFHSRVQQPEDRLIDCLQGALHHIISQESEEYSNVKGILESDDEEVVNLKNLSGGSKVDPSLNKATNKNLTGNNNVEKHPQDDHIEIVAAGTCRLQQGVPIPVVMDVILSINNSANRNVFQDSPCEAHHEKATDLDKPVFISHKSGKHDFIKRVNNRSKIKGFDIIHEDYEKAESADHVKSTPKALSDNNGDKDLSKVRNDASYSVNTNYSANGHGSSSNQEETNLKHSGKQEVTDVKCVDLPGSDTDDNGVDSQKVVTKGIVKDEDTSVKYQLQEESDIIGIKLNTDAENQSKNKRTDSDETSGNISGLFVHPRKDNEGADEVEKTISINDSKTQEKKIEANRSDLGIRDLEEEMSNQEHKITKLPRVSFKNVEVDEDSNTEDEHNVRSDCHGVKENILFAEDSTSEESVEKLSLQDLAFGMDGYKHFKLYAEIDKNIRVNELQDAKEALKMNYNWRAQQIDEIICVATEYYKNPKNSKAVSEWHELKKTVSVEKRSTVKSNTDIKFHLASLHEHRTIFTYILIAMQLVSVIVTCILGKLTYIGLEPKLELMTGVKTFMGTEMVHKWIPPNVWIGPSEKYLISIGALYAPCMREDYGIQIDLSKKGYKKTSILGCCEVASRNVAGTTTQSECVNITNGVGEWREGVVCSERPSGQNSVGHVLKPCCTGLQGECQLLSHKHCQFLEGSFHVNGHEHCSQVNCLSSVCGMGGFEPDHTHPWLPRDPIQWWRLPLSLVYHHGLIHAILVSLAQILLFRKIEQTLGWLRLIIVYLMTGLGGLLTAAIFSPYMPHVGGTSTVFGMAGLITAELVHYWHLVQKPAVELTKIFLLLVIFLMCGTLPYIDNYSIVSGFLLGFFCSVFFLPFMSFRQQQKHCRILLLCLGGPVIFLVYFVLFYVFYRVQTLEECSGCKLFNCVPYTKAMCDNLL
ncbi:uncharacterized protein LOC132544063 [Ylistrum balloti]|uniref:uncharacterized protein LOC132544063 n=1 Tax=Ylistrum balloti TaxID=509963 RepID=UPI0029057EA7|nr:uncharacterized protein LOC132544063 [Ylistrum balloti]